MCPKGTRGFRIRDLVLVVAILSLWLALFYGYPFVGVPAILLGVPVLVIIAKQSGLDDHTDHGTSFCYRLYRWVVISGILTFAFYVVMGPPID
jgi:hypothetical protein